jgi:HPt (histidine-containing phosphotransfer) domain-containing protein
MEVDIGSSAATVPVLNPAALEGLRELQEPGTADLVRETIAVFLADADDRLRELNRSIAAADSARFRRGAHSLKGAALLIGAQRLAQACLALESTGLSGQLDGAEDMLRRLQEELDLLRPALRSFLA